jgi:hypothetical protein
MLLRNIRAKGGSKATPLLGYPRLLWAAFAAQSKGIQPLENPDQWNAAIGFGNGGGFRPANLVPVGLAPAPAAALDWQFV